MQAKVFHKKEITCYKSNNHKQYLQSVITNERRLRTVTISDDAKKNLRL